MKRLVCALLILILLCSCAPQSGLSSESENSLNSSPVSLNSSAQLSSQSSGSSSATREETLKIGPIEYPEEIPQTFIELRDQWSHPELDIPVVDTYADEITVSGNVYMPSITNETPLEKMLFVIGMGKVFEVNANCDDRWTEGMHYSISYSNPNVDIDPLWYRPVNFLRQTQPGCYYTVQKVEGGGYAYFFYERMRYPDGEYVTEDMTDVLCVGVIYMEKALVRADFDSISIGSTIDDVMAIDNAAGITKYWAQTYDASVGEKLDAVLSKHLLKDGLLVYKYEYEGDTLVVTDIVFSEDFLFVTPLEMDGSTEPKHFAILPQDYPQ